MKKLLKKIYDFEKMKLEDWELFLESKDFYSQDKHGKSALYYVSRKGWTAIVKRLIKKGVDVNIKNRTSPYQTPLHQVNNKDVLCLLIEKGADIQAPDHAGNTPLHTAWSGEIIKILLESGADIDLENKKGNTPLEEILEKLNFSLSFSDRYKEEIKNLFFKQRIIKEKSHLIQSIPQADLESSLKNKKTHL